MMNAHWRHPTDPTAFRLRRTARENITLFLLLFIAAIALIYILLWATSLIAAELPKDANKSTTECPNIGQPCKIVVLTPQEEDMLVRQGGVLDSASAARFLDLGNVAAYFRLKLAQAPAGEIKQPPALPEKKPEAPQGTVNPAK